MTGSLLVLDTSKAVAVEAVFVEVKGRESLQRDLSWSKNDDERDTDQRDVGRCEEEVVSIGR